MIVTLKPETETILRERAGRAGQDIDTFTNILLADVLADDPVGFGQQPDTRRMYRSAEPSGRP